MHGLRWVGQRRHPELLAQSVNGLRALLGQHGQGAVNGFQKGQAVVVGCAFGQWFIRIAHHPAHR